MIWIIIPIIVLAILASCIKIVPQAQAYVVERLGAYQGTWHVGVKFLVPFIDRVARRVTLKEQVVDFAPQPVITKDNVTMRIDTVVFFQITDPKLFAYGVENPLMAIENLTAEIQNAMEKQMKAERERREAVTRAEGEKRASILQAEGEKQSAILKAEAEKEAAILRAEAEKEKRIREAEGQAEAILKVQNAKAEGLRMLKEAGADEAVLRLKSLEAFEKAADGQATKIIIPSEIQGIAGLASGLKEIITK